MQPWWRKLDKFGPETRQAWVRIFTFWQLLSLPLVLVFILPVVWVTVGNSSADLTSSSNHPGMSMTLMLITMAVLFLRLGQLMYQSLKRVNQVKARVRQPTMPSEEQRRQLDPQVAWLIGLGFNPVVNVTWESEANAMFGRVTGGFGASARQAVNEQTMYLSSRLLSIGLNDAELRAVLAEGVARTSMPAQINGANAAFLFSFMSVYVALRSLPYTLFHPVQYAAILVFVYVVLVMGVQYLFIKWSTLAGNYICLLQDSMAVSLTGEPQALASAITKAMAAGPGDSVPEMFAQMMFVSQETGRRLAPVPWNLPVPSAAAHILRGSSTLVEARLHNLAAITRDEWPAFGIASYQSGALAPRAAQMPFLPPAQSSSLAGTSRRRVQPAVKLAGEEGIFSCSRCGAENSADATYCALCLTPFASPAVQAPPTAAVR